MVEATYTGPEQVECRGAVHTGPNAEGDLARALIGAGVEPGELLVFSRNRVPALRGTVGRLCRPGLGRSRCRSAIPAMAAALPRAATPISCCSGTRRGWSGSDP
jgi:hypothetical protein